MARGAWQIDGVPGGVSRDRGCSYSPTCLACPLPVCRYDAPPKAMKQAAIRAAWEGAADTPGRAHAVAIAHGVSERTVHRTVQHAAPKTPPPAEDMTPLGALRRLAISSAFRQAPPGGPRLALPAS